MTYQLDDYDAFQVSSGNRLAAVSNAVCLLLLVSSDSQLIERSEDLSLLMNYEAARSPPCVVAEVEATEFVFKCSECHEEHPDIERLEGHLWTQHLRTYPLQCSLCSYPGLSSKSMEDHFARCHPGTTGSSIEFKRRLDHESILQTLLAQSVQIAVRQSEAIAQLYEDHELSGESGIFFRCLECNEKHQSIDRLEIHVWACHLRTFPYNCSLCSYPGLNEQLMVEHFATSHNGTPHPP
ncbi:hypothetical protein L596_008399 [Steinernema carpocapsae]|uniref:C2H2-type domain-containing protein n=1 Tax=Steinernema carpocapsae TaxID=34508 RepID=A0A4U5PCM4_STECR|nr:hypothetical protein L596_008399 [Steinernema carpocapsae]